jgi:hypothetical protein
MSASFGARRLSSSMSGPRSWTWSSFRLPKVSMLIHALTPPEPPDDARVGDQREFRARERRRRQHERDHGQVGRVEPGQHRLFHLRREVVADGEVGDEHDAARLLPDRSGRRPRHRHRGAPRYRPGRAGEQAD